MDCESFDVATFDLGPLLQGQTRIEKPKSANNVLIIGPRGLLMVNQPIGNHGLRKRTTNMVLKINSIFKPKLRKY